MVSRPDRLLPGLPYPLGATWDGLGTNFAVFSANATKIELCLFDPSARRQIAALRAAGMHRRGLARLPAQRARRPDLRLSRARSLRAAPWPSLQSPQAAARSLCAAPGRRASHLRRAVRLPRELAARRPLLRPARQRARHVEGGGGRRQLQLGRRSPARRAVVRYRHLRGPCARPQHAAPGPAAQRARNLRRPGAIRTSSTICAGSASPRSSCCRSMPSCRTALCCRRACETTGATTPSASLRLEPRYLSDNTVDEMRIAVRRLHAAGIEVILDVVYNHTAEGSELGPTLSFRGLDNASYYRLVAGQSPPLRQRYRHRQHAESVARRACCRW